MFRLDETRRRTRAAKQLSFRVSAHPSERASFFLKDAGSHLFSHTVSSAVPSAAYVLTIVFGMGTGVSLKRIATGNIRYLILQRLSRFRLRFISMDGRSPYGQPVPDTLP